jgi:hypothetical protein
VNETPNPYGIGYEVLNEVALHIIDHGDALGAIVDAFVPAHHAVFDTRTHVAVPVAELREILSSVNRLNMSDEDVESLVADWLLSRDEADAFLMLRSLLPNEEPSDV